MVSAVQLVAFAVTSFTLIAIPGPSVLFIIGQALAQGRRGGLLSVIGNELGGLPAIVAVAFGLGAVVAQSALLFTTIKVLGAGYLVFLGVQAILHRRMPTPTSKPGHRRDDGYRLITQGFLVGATNPKSVVFFVAVLPQFVSFDAGAVPLQILTLGLTFTLVALVCDCCWAVAAGSAQAWFATSPHRMARLRTVGGALMIGLAGAVLLTGDVRNRAA